MLEDLVYTTTKLGKDGKPIVLHKIRTMVGGSDSQRFSLRNSNGVDELGKIVDDPRIISSRKFLRKYWLDELPQIWNLLKGEVSLVGVRARDEEEWEERPPELKEAALRYKPGLIPPSYAYTDVGKIGGVMVADTQYLHDKEVNPLMTDIKYFFKFVYNVIFKGVRSK